MITLYKKGSLPYYIGDQSPSPWDLLPNGQKHETRAVQSTLPHASVTSCGAQVASQQSLILQTDMGIVSKLIGITSKRLSKNKKKEGRFKTTFKKLEKYNRIIHPKLTLKIGKNLS